MFKQQSEAAAPRLQAQRRTPTLSEKAGAARDDLEAVRVKPRPELRSRTRSKPRPGKPRMFRVVVLNDDYTPMDFVVHALQRFFHFSLEKATRLMLDVHTTGRGVCGTFSREVAETKVLAMNRYARAEKHPLLCVMEPDVPC